MPTYKDVDFRNNMQKVYVSEAAKEKIMDKLNRDIEVKSQSAAVSMSVCVYVFVYFQCVCMHS